MKNEQFIIKDGNFVPASPEDIERANTDFISVRTLEELNAKKSELMANGAAIEEEGEGYVKLALPYISSATPHMMGPTGPHYIKISMENS